MDVCLSGTSGQARSSTSSWQTHVSSTAYSHILLPTVSDIIITSCLSTVTIDDVCNELKFQHVLCSSVNYPVSLLCVVIATSGIDYNVKLWEPVAEQLASLDGLEEVRSLCLYMYMYM